jgi:hypothetical protein
MTTPKKKDEPHPSGHRDTHGHSEAEKEKGAAKHEAHGGGHADAGGGREGGGWRPDAAGDRLTLAREILDREMPGVTIVRRLSDAERPHPKPDAVTPDLATLRTKFLGPAGGRGRPSDAADVEEAGDDSGPDDTVTLQVVPEGSNTSDVGESSSGPKTVIISVSKGKVIGFQG